MQDYADRRAKRGKRGTSNVAGRLQLDSTGRVARTRPVVVRFRERQRTHPWPSGPANGTYRDGMAGLPAVNRARFSRFIEHALADARSRGLTHAKIAKTTGVGTSTFHRWVRADYKEMPEMDKVVAFCTGLGIPVAEALAALGMTGQRDTTAPGPPLDPDVVIILRALADPNVPEREKDVIRRMLQMLAQQAANQSRGRIRRPDDPTGVVAEAS